MCLSVNQPNELLKGDNDGTATSGHSDYARDGWTSELEPFAQLEIWAKRRVGVGVCDCVGFGSDGAYPARLLMEL